MTRHSGISSEKLLEWVESSAPFLFEAPDETGPGQGWLRILCEARKRPPPVTDLYGYFELCLASHFATVGSFVPTDVDLAIREKLWSWVHAEGVLEEMWLRTRAFQEWDERPVSRRRVEAPGVRPLSGIQGEWLTVAMGAYGTARRIHSPRLGEIREAVELEVALEEESLRSLRELFLDSPDAEGMKRYLWGVAAVAHNLGDLDRMLDAFPLGEEDVLKRRVYRSGHEDARNPRAVFVEAGRIYQQWLASENHRNFALRSPKSLRRSARFLLPFGLFLDDWGEREVAAAYREGILSEGDLREIIEALTLGWQKLNPQSIYTSQGYARALTGIARGLGGRSVLETAVPPAVRKVLTESGLRTHLGVPKEEFERKRVLRLAAELSREREASSSQ